MNAKEQAIAEATRVLAQLRGHVAPPKPKPVKPTDRRPSLQPTNSYQAMFRKPENLIHHLDFLQGDVESGTMRAEINNAFATGNTPELAERITKALTERVARIEFELTIQQQQTRRTFNDLVMAERFRLYYAAADAGRLETAARLLAELERMAAALLYLPDVHQLQAAARASDAVAHAVRCLKPRDKELFNALPDRFRGADVADVAARLNYPPTSATRRAVPRFHSYQLIDRTDAGWLKVVPLLVE